MIKVETSVVNPDPAGNFKARNFKEIKDQKLYFSNISGKKGIILVNFIERYYD